MVAGREYLGVLRAGLGWILLSTVIGGVLGYLFVPGRSVTHSSEVYVAVRVTGAADIVALSGASRLAENQTVALSALGTSGNIQGQVLEQARVEPWRRDSVHVNVDTITETNFVHVTATSPDSNLSSRVASVMAATLSNMSDELSPRTRSGTVVLSAKPTGAPVTAEEYKGVGKGLLTIAAGVLFGTATYGLLLIRGVARRRVRDRRDVEAVAPGQYLGACTLSGTGNQGREDARFLVARLGWMDSANEAKTAMVTTVSGMTKGSESVGLKLARAAADGGSKVLVVDAGFDAGSMAVENGSGLSGDAVRAARDYWAVDPVETGGVHVLTGEKHPLAFVSAVRSLGQEDRLRALTSGYDVVIFDASRCRLRSVLLALASVSRSSLVVVTPGETEIEELRTLLEDFRGYTEPSIVLAESLRHRGPHSTISAYLERLRGGRRKDRSQGTV